MNLLLFAFLSLFCAKCAFAQTTDIPVSISVGEVSATSTVTGEHLLILLTKETVTCSASLAFNEGNQTIYDTQTLFSVFDANNETTIPLYYSVYVNDAMVDSGAALINQSLTHLHLPDTITSNEISIDDNTGDNAITIYVSFDESFTTDSDATYSGNNTFFTITGFTTMVPLIFVILFVLVLRNVYVSLFLVIWIGSFIISGCSFRYAFELAVGTYILDSCANADHQFVILFCVFLSGLVFLIQRSGGTQGFSLLVRRMAKTAKRTQFATFLAGLLIFFSDYANALVVGATFQPLTDMFHISREKLAFLVDATSAPVASIVPISGWIGFELQQIQQQLDAIKETNGGIMPEGLTDNAFVFFIDTIPTRFYPIYLLAFQVTIMSLSIEFGPMLVAERLVRVDERTDGGRGKAVVKTADDEDELHSGAEPKKGTPGRWWNMLVPIITLIVLILSVIINTGVEGIEKAGAEMNARNMFAYSSSWRGLLYGTFGASIFTIAFLMVQFKYRGNIVPPSIAACKNCLFHSKKQNKKDDDDDQDIALPLMTFGEAIETWVQGIAFMSGAVCILILVWAIGAIMTDVGADRYFTRMLMSDDLNPASLPSIVFVLAALISATTGTSWGTMTIMFPLVSPAAWAICKSLHNGVVLYTATMSQILSGSIFGDHSSPLSDTTLLSSVASGCDIFRHVWTQIAYACWVAVFAIVCGTAMVGDGVSAGVCIFVGIVVQTLCTWLVGAPVVAKSGRFDAITELYWFCASKCKKDEDEKEEEEKELVVLKRKTIEFVKNGHQSDPDYVLKLLQWTKLNLLCAKCGISIENDEDNAATRKKVKTSIDVAEQVQLTQVDEEERAENVMAIATATTPEPDENQSTEI